MSKKNQKTFLMEAVAVNRTSKEGVYQIVCAVDQDGMLIKSNIAVRDNVLRNVIIRETDEDGIPITQGTLVEITGEISSEYSTTTTININASRAVNLENNQVMYNSVKYDAPSADTLRQRLEAIKSKATEPALV
jgi:DNA/RNA endonuclease YhcR with UshA esterase domain